jgi:DNA-binding Xre family transcriptional regulator
MARKAHLSKTTISNLESGKQVKIELDTIGKLCQALDCTPNDLFEFESGTEGNIAKKQKNALENFIGSLEYDKKFDPADLDMDLAKKINK